jgi:uncharacterized protein (TIGR02453 family)
MVFTGWPDEAVEFYEGLEVDNTKTYWQRHKSVYEQSVKAPMEELLAELADSFGPGRVFRPYRDVRFSQDRTPYKLSCAAHVSGGYLSFSADGLFAGSGLYDPSADQLRRFRQAVDEAKSGSELVSIVAVLRDGGYEVGAHEVLKTAPRGYPKDHPRIDLLKQKGLVMSKSWPVGPWLGTKKAKDRVVGLFEAPRPPPPWVERYAGHGG